MTQSMVVRFTSDPSRFFKPKIHSNYRSFPARSADSQSVLAKPIRANGLQTITASKPNHPEGPFLVQFREEQSSVWQIPLQPIGRKCNRLHCRLATKYSFPFPHPGAASARSIPASSTCWNSRDEDDQFTTSRYALHRECSCAKRLNFPA